MRLGICLLGPSNIRKVWNPNPARAALRINAANLILGAVLMWGGARSLCQAVDLSTTNRDCLARFWSACAPERQRPVTVLSFGDSMADSYRSIAFVFMNQFRGKLGVAGYSLNNYRNTAMYSITNGTTITMPDALWFTGHYTIPPEGGLWWESQLSPGGVWSDRAGLFYVAYPGGGTFTLSISTNAGSWTPLLTLDGYAPTPLGRFTNLDLALNYYRIRVDGQSGTNVIIGPQLLNTRSNGVHVAFADFAGISLGDVTNVPYSIRFPIFQALAPDLLIWHMKEGLTGLTEAMVECERWWSNACPACDVLYIGTPWISQDIDGTLTVDQNTIVRSIALNYRRAYVDCMNPAVSYQWMLTNGYMQDPTHENLTGNTYLANIAWPDLGFFAVGAPRTLQVSPGAGGLLIQYQTSPGIQYTVEASSRFADWLPILSTVGDGTVVSTNISNAAAQQFFRLRLQPSQ